MIVFDIKKLVEFKFFIIKVWFKLYGKDNYFRYVIIFDIFIMKWIIIMCKFYFNGFLYILYIEKVI